jgi:hypothetical protein
MAAWRHLIHTHSSTVATNALIERRGARIGLLVSAGFRDRFELQRLPHKHDHLILPSSLAWLTSDWRQSASHRTPRWEEEAGCELVSESEIPGFRF